MKKSGIFLAAASAVIFFCSACSAGENAVLALNTVKPAAPAIKTELQAQTTAQAAVPCQDPCDYDALSAVNDPLYREGSKEFLQQVAKQDAAVKEEARPAAKPALRDAPNSGSKAAPARVQPAPHPAIKKPVKKTGPVDPVKVKNTL